MRIAITGGNGTVGRAVVELALKQGHSVVSIDRAALEQPENRPNLDFVQAEITRYEELEEALRGCEGLVHLAAYPSPGKLPDYVIHNNNVVGSYNALSAAAHLGITKVCQASSVNAIGAVYSRWPHYDYFPLDEQHPTYNEDPYSLSKWICEQQADSIARRYEDMTISSLRFHGVGGKPGTPHPFNPLSENYRAKDLWGFTRLEAVARAALLALSADFKGHEVFFIVAPVTTMSQLSLELKQEYYPDVPVQGDLSGNRGFFNCNKAERLLGWKHDEA
ncbi:MAG TPA: NAD(P)-dependent oxidoreductase [Chloroflexia bacterium]|nr:NAD(P)-dependent oxidoreductase [Chloroflexia bacterium]